MRFSEIFAKVHGKIIIYVSSIQTGALALGWLLCYCINIFNIKFNLSIALIYIMFISIVMIIVICILYKKIITSLVDQSLIDNCCGNTLEKVTELKNNPLKYFNIILVKELMECEKKAMRSVWILTADLSLENDDTVRDVMKNNMKSGKKYIYFLPDDKKFRSSVKRLLDSYEDEKEYMEIHYLNKQHNAFLLPKFDVVLYDPMSKERQGYCCVGISEGNNKSLYRKMSLNEIDMIVSDLSYAL